MVLCCAVWCVVWCVVWCMVCGVVCGVWCVVCGVWCVVCCVLCAGVCCVNHRCTGRVHQPRGIMQQQANSIDGYEWWWCGLDQCQKQPQCGCHLLGGIPWYA